MSGKGVGAGCGDRQLGVRLRLGARGVPGGGAICEEYRAAFTDLDVTVVASPT